MYHQILIPNQIHPLKTNDKKKYGNDFLEKIKTETNITGINIYKKALMGYKKNSGKNIAVLFYVNDQCYLVLLYFYLSDCLLCCSPKII